MSTKDQPKVTVRSVSEYQTDSRNPHKGTPRGRKTIRGSLERNGVGRSLVADKDDVLIAGNKTLEEAAAAGITKVIEVETDGDALLVHKRRDLDLDGDDGRARDLSWSDNRSADFHDYDPAVLAADLESGFDFDTLFRGDEIDDILNAGAVDSAVGAAVENGGAGGGNRLSGNKAAQVKPVLYPDELATFERALRATGIDNRGQALIEVCRHYLETHSEGGTGETAIPL